MHGASFPCGGQLTLIIFETIFSQNCRLQGFKLYFRKLAKPLVLPPPPSPCTPLPPNPKCACNMSHVMRKPVFCKCEHIDKGENLCRRSAPLFSLFGWYNSTSSIQNLKVEASYHLQLLYSLVLFFGQFFL